MKLYKAISLTILYYLLIELIGFWILLFPDEMENLVFIKSLHFINSIVTLIFLLLIFKSFKQNDLIKFKKTNSNYYFIAFILGIGFVFFQSILNIFYNLELSSELFDYDFNLDKLTSLNVIASILIVPITEELFFRNYILRGLLENYKPLLAIILSSLLFAFIHIHIESLFFEFINFSIHQAYIAVFGGLISGILFYKSKSIIPSIIFHIFWNLTSYIL